MHCINDLCSTTYFSPVLWPQFTLWHLLAGVVYYQRQLRMREAGGCGLEAGAARGDGEDRLEQARQVAAILQNWNH